MRASESVPYSIGKFLRKVGGVWRRNPSLVLTPDLTIVDATGEYVRSTLLWREEFRGRSMFDVFPDNPRNAGADGVRNLRASFQSALRYGAPDKMAVQRYDVFDRVSPDGGWVEKYWAPVNIPVFADGSREITHLVHEVVDVTEPVLLARWIEEQSRIADEQRATLEQMLHDLSKRSRLLSKARDRMDSIATGRSSASFAINDVRTELCGPEYRVYYSPGEVASINGIYRVFHRDDCEDAPIRISMRPGTVFRPCLHCKDEALYRLERRLGP